MRMLIASDQAALDRFNSSLLESYVEVSMHHSCYGSPCTAMGAMSWQDSHNVFPHLQILRDLKQVTHQGPQIIQQPWSSVLMCCLRYLSKSKVLLRAASTPNHSSDHFPALLRALRRQ